MRDREHMGMRRRRDSERGQATVEFAIILFPFLFLVTGIIWFGIGLNYWLDMQRIANQGARWAVVNCGPQASVVCNPSLQSYLAAQPLSRGNRPTVTICYVTKTGPNGTATIGDPVTVKLVLPGYQLVPMLGIRRDLVASATMRMEQAPTQGGLNTAPTC